MARAHGVIEKSNALTEYYTAKQLKEDLKQRDLSWHQKFAVTNELREGQARSQESMETGFKETHARIDACVRDLVPRAEVEKRMNILVKEVQGVMDKCFENGQLLSGLIARVDRLEKHGAETFATKSEHEMSQKRQAEDLRESRADAQREIDSVRKDSAPVVDVDAKFTAASERSAGLEEDTQVLRRDLAKLDKTLEALRHTTEDRFAKKLGLKETEATLMLEIQRRHDTHSATIEELRTSHASKMHVEDRVSNCQSSLEVLRTIIADLKGELDTKKKGLAELTELCNTKLAKRDDLQVLSDGVQGDRAAASVMRTDFDQLAENVMTERQRLDALGRSVQSNRSDTNELLLQRQEFLDLRDDVGRTKKVMAQFNETIEHREGEHHRELRAEVLTLKGAIEDSERKFQSCQDECRKMVDKHADETKGLVKEQSTLRYMEAMDRALGLNDTVNKLQKKLSEPAPAAKPE